MNQVKLRFDHWIPKLISTFFPIAAITLGSSIYFTNPRWDVSEVLIRHELQHIYQIKNDGLTKFYFLYCYYYIVGLLKYRSHLKAYLMIPYEQDARAMQYAKLTESEKKIVGLS